MNLLEQLKKNPFVLAPMAGITDTAFRSFMRELGASVVISELVSANGLKYSPEKTKKLMRYSEDQRPVGIQLFGESPEVIAEAAKVVEQSGADFVDLNFGCPVPKVVKKGAGSALLKDPLAFAEVLRVVKSAVQIPVTIKVRTGWDEGTRNTPELAHIAASEGMTWIAIHGRTRAQGYSGKADWDYIAEAKLKSPIPVLGNGDLTSAEKAVAYLKSSGCDGVMIGRGCLKNPWIFKESLDLYQDKSSSGSFAHRDFSWAFDRLRHFLKDQMDERVTILQIKKFSAWFSAGYPDSAQFRREIFKFKELGPLCETVEQYFSSLQSHSQTDTSHEPFLMGGHG